MIFEMNQGNELLTSHSSLSLVGALLQKTTGGAFFADCDTERHNTNEVVRYLRQKYQLRQPTITQFTLVNMPVDP